MDFLPLALVVDGPLSCSRNAWFVSHEFDAVPVAPWEKLETYHPLLSEA